MANRRRLFLFGLLAALVLFGVGGWWHASAPDQIERDIARRMELWTSMQTVPESHWAKVRRWLRL